MTQEITSGNNNLYTYNAPDECRVMKTPIDDY